EQGPSASPALRPDARQAQRSQQTIITNLLQQALRDVELNVLFDETVMLLNQQFDVDYCGVFELLSYQQGFVLKAGKGWPEGAVGQFVTPIDLNSAVGYRLLSGEPVLMGALQKDDRAESLLAYPPEINSFLSVLISGASHQPLGYIGLASRQGHQFTEDDAIFLRAVANVIAMAMERKRSEQSIRAHIQELACMTTVLAKTNDKLAERNRELNEFAYIASHDLKAPLRAIANLSEWIEEDLQDRPEPGIDYYMRLLRKRVFRIESLLNGLLQYSRVGRTQIEAESVATRAVVVEVVDLLDPPATFTVVVGDNMPILKTRRLPLLQAFSSLISNAIKHHNSQSGCVEITAKRLENFYEFTVADNGPGIAPEHHEKIFSIFQVLEPRDKTENMGVGLAIARKIVEAEGGKISLESELGQGATFKFTWPVQ
ncbi:MAG: ATP-binding protein, partial [Cyanobacteria bacterium P01_A01_bin.135]